jgi:hypothetical protein
MQIFKSSKQHVAVIMMLEICFSLTNGKYSNIVNYSLLFETPEFIWYLDLSNLFKTKRKASYR